MKQFIFTSYFDQKSMFYFHSCSRPVAFSHRFDAPATVLCSFLFIYLLSFSQSRFSFGLSYIITVLAQARTKGVIHANPRYAHKRLHLPYSNYDKANEANDSVF